MAYAAEEMAAWRVDSRVGNVRDDDATLLEPVAGNEAALPDGSLLF